MVLHFSPIILLMFAGGLIAAVLVRYRSFTRFAASGTAAVMAIASLGTAVALFPSAYGLAPFVLLTLFFCIIAGGNDLLGLLSHPAALKMGEMAYSIYLLHGIILYITFELIMGTARSRALSPVQYWEIVIALIPALLLICHVSFRFIEYPPMQKTRALHSWLTTRLSLRFSRVAS